MDKVWICIIAFIIGVLLTIHLIHNDIPYRISMYGYRKLGKEIIPIIKLRKNIYRDKSFHILDDGIPLEIGLLEVGSDSMEFTDKKIDEIIKERYCK